MHEKNLAREDGQPSAEHGDLPRPATGPSVRFTSGPWRVEQAAGGWYRNRRTVAAKFYSSPGVFDGRDIVAEINGPDSDVAEANARLIAAAPRMFERIERLAADGDAESLAIMEVVYGRS